MKALISICFNGLFIGFVFCQTPNEYGVKVFNDVAVYNQLVKINPSFKLVDLKNYENLFFDIRYATENNFTEQIIYNSPDAFARRLVAEALNKANTRFNQLGFAIKLYDAYRPYDATVKFYEIFKDTTYVASPYAGSRHNRGCAVDITLVELNTVVELQMQTEYDDFTEKAHPDYQDLSEDALNNRKFLIETMQQFGFTVYPSEWWHFDFNDWRKYPLMNLTFEELKQ